MSQRNPQNEQREERDAGAVGLEGKREGERKGYGCGEEDSLFFILIRLEGDGRGREH